MRDEHNRKHVLTLDESLQRSISSLQKLNIIDATLQLIQNEDRGTQEYHQQSKFLPKNQNPPSTTHVITDDSISKPSGFSILLQLYEKNQDIVLDAIHFANDIKIKRQSSLQEFHERLHRCRDDSSSKCIDDVVIVASSHGSSRDGNNIKPVSSTPSSHVGVENSNVKYVTQLEFKQNYLYLNIPCIIHSLNQQDFKSVSNNWMKEHTNGHDRFSSQSCVNTDWFLNEIGSSTMVPVRKMPNVNYTNEEQESSSNEVLDGDLDEDGRAVECETIEMTMKDWIDILTRQNIENDEVASSSMVDSTLYLKDWHLQKILEDKWIVSSGQQECSSTSMPNVPNYTSSSLCKELYTVPKIFAGDVFNPFLLANGGGDYRFVYWGPKGSSTSIHSDVLNSFSWSFNVVGEKVWKFYTPPQYQSNQMPGTATVAHEQRKDSEEENVVSKKKEQEKTFEIIQKTGETIYVPSRWKHSVQNLRETLSINHNWITPSTLDEMYECILSEIRAIDKELSEWGMFLNDEEDEEEEINGHLDFGNLESFRMRENMLRGCVGMDVTSFCTMMMTCLSDCFVKFDKITEEMKSAPLYDYQEELLWEHWFDFTSIVNVFYCVLLDEKGQPRLHVQKRICSVLGKQLGMKVNILMKQLVISCNTVILGISCKQEVVVKS